MAGMNKVAELVQVPVFQINNDGFIVYINSFFSDYTGYTNEIALSSTLPELLKVAPAESYNSLIKDILAGIKIGSGIFHIQIKGGQLVSVNIKMVADDDSDGLTITGVLEAVPGVIAVSSNNGTTQNRIETYSTIYNLTFESIFIHENGIIIDVNPAMERLTEYSREELIGKNIIPLCIMPESHETVINAMRHELTSPYEVRAFSKNGRVIFAEAESRRIHLDGRPVRITAIRDLTLRKEAEKALKESEERYKRLSDITPDGIFLHKHGIVVDANQALANMIGFPQDEIIGKNIIELAVLPEYHHVAILAVKNETSNPYELKARRKNGEVFWVEIEARMVDYHGEWLRVTAARDITWRKNAEKTIRESEEELDSFFTRSGDGFFIMRLDAPINWIANTGKENLLEQIASSMRLVKINTTMKQQLDMGQQDPIGKPLNELFPWDDFTRTLFSNLFNNENVTFETSEFRRGGSTVWIEGNYLVLHDEVGNIRGCCGVRRDITERKKSDEAILSHNEELKKTNKELDNFVYRVSHDLKAPISSAKGLINIARLETERDKIGECLALIETSMNKLDSFILDILDYSRNSRIALEPTPIHFDSLIDEVLSNTKFLQHSKKVRVEKSVSENGDFYSDQRRLIFILNNIISNAIRFSDESKPESYLKIDVEISSSIATLSFRDNGIGIHPQHLDRIFEMFYRASESRAGSGLGLYIVKEAVDKLSGSVTVTSQPGIGTSFKIAIPNMMKVR